MKKGDQIAFVRWIDSHQSGLEINMTSGARQVLHNISKDMRPGVQAYPCYTVHSARYATEDHSAIVASTHEAGDVVVSERDTPALWHHVLGSGVPIADYAGERRAAPNLTVVADAPEVEPIPLPEAGKAPAGRSWPLAALLRKASVEPRKAPETPPEAIPLDLGAMGLMASVQETQPDVSADPPEPPLSDEARRHLAKDRIRQAVLDWMKQIAVEQPRYELALQVANNQPRSMQLMEGEAKIAGKSVQELARAIIAIRHAQQRRMSFVYEEQARAVANIDNATGDEIDRIADAATSTIHDNKD